MGPSSQDRYVCVCVSGAECEKRWWRGAGGGARPPRGVHAAPYQLVFRRRSHGVNHALHHSLPRAVSPTRRTCRRGHWGPGELTLSVQKRYPSKVADGDATATFQWGRERVRSRCAGAHTHKGWYRTGERVGMLGRQRIHQDAAFSSERRQRDVLRQRGVLRGGFSGPCTGAGSPS